MPKILLVEDDNSLREIYGIRLMAEGYKIVAAGDGEAALAMVAKEKPDLVLLDVMMPKISGFDMLDIMRSTPEIKDTKVIMMTALSALEQQQRGESLGADRYLVKSQVGIEDVVRVVKDVLEGKPEMAPEPATPQMMAAAEVEKTAAAPLPVMPQNPVIQMKSMREWPKTHELPKVEPPKKTEEKGPEQPEETTNDFAAMAAMPEVILPDPDLKLAPSLDGLANIKPNEEKVVEGARDLSDLIGTAAQLEKMKKEEEVDGSSQKKTVNVFAMDEKEFEIGEIKGLPTLNQDPAEAERLRKILEDEIAKMEGETGGVAGDGTNAVGGVGAGGAVNGANSGAGSANGAAANPAQ